MAVDAFMLFETYGGDTVKSESQVSLGDLKGDTIGTPFKAKEGSLFEVTTFSFDVEQTINMSSQSSGAGAGKIQFNPFKITRKIDRATPEFFKHACQGTPFKVVTLGFRKASGTSTSGLFFLRFDFRLVALKSINWSHDDESPTEDLEFEYGGLQVVYGRQKSDGSIETINPAGWNKLTNKLEVGDASKAPEAIKA